MSSGTVSFIWNLLCDWDDAANCGRLGTAHDSCDAANLDKVYTPLESLDAAPLDGSDATLLDILGAATMDSINPG